MGFASMDDLVNQITSNGKFLSREALKSTAPVHTASGWHLLVGLSGFPSAGTFPGTSLLWSACDENSGDGTTKIGMSHGGPPGGSATKHVVNAGAQIIAAAGSPWQAKLVDLMGYYPLNNADSISTGSRTLVNADTIATTLANPCVATTTTYDFKTLTKVRFTTSGTLPASLVAGTDYWLVRTGTRTYNIATSYANALAGTYVNTSLDSQVVTHTATARVSRSMAGCEAFFVCTGAPSGGGGPSLTASSYTNSNGTAAKSFTGSPTSGASADTYATRVIHSGAAAGRYGAFLPKADGDTGIQSIESFTLGATAYTGAGTTLALCIARPVGVDLYLPATGVWSERDLVNQLPSLPKVDDGACLAWLFFGAGATTTGSPILSRLDFAWGG